MNGNTSVKGAGSVNREAVPYGSVSRGKRQRKCRFRFAAAALLSVIMLLTGCGGSSAADSASAAKDKTEKDARALEAVFFDVGKGDCILVSMGEDHILIDAGYEETSEEIIKELAGRGVDSLDAMIITHYDKDHVGGAAEIAQEIPVGTFYLPDYIGDEDKCGDLLQMIDREKLQAERVSEDTELELGEASVRIDAALIPYDPEEKNDNDASLIVEILYGEDEWLLPGDIEKDAIEVWLAGRTGHYDVLKLPHHGKKEKNSKEFIETVSPGIAVITDSEEEDASDKILKNLEKENTKVFRSSGNGTITITGSGDEEYTVETEKQ